MIIAIPRVQFKSVVNPGKYNIGPNHLSHVHNGETTQIVDGIFDADLFCVEAISYFFIDIAEILGSGLMSENYDW